MSGIGKPERATQNRVAALFRDKLGYRHLGDWSDRAGNGNIDEALLTRHLSAGYSPTLIGRALDVLRHEAAPRRKGSGQRSEKKAEKTPVQTRVRTPVKG